LVRHAGLNFLADIIGDFPLERKRIEKIASVAVGREVPVAGSLDELRRDAYLIARSIRGALKDSVHAEFTVVPVAESVLGNQVIMDLYLNVVELGSGVYGAEPACRSYYRISARNIDRQQSAQLAAILPLP
jgi:transglycosylase-like protein